MNVRPSLGLSPRVAAILVAALGASHGLPAKAQQHLADSTLLGPDPVLGVPLGGDRQLVGGYFTARGWAHALDSNLGGTTNVAVFTGTFDGRPAEAIATFGTRTGHDRLINLVLNLPVASDTALASTYVWAYRRMESLRCKADLPPDYLVQLDSLLTGKRVGIPPRSRVLAQLPIAPAHSSMITENNLDWPDPSWLTTNGVLGTRLIAAGLAPESRWPYEVEVWTSTLFAAGDGVTICPDTRAALAQHRSTRVVRPAAPGERIVMDTLLVVLSQGLHGHVDTLSLSTTDPRSDDVREYNLAFPRGSKLAYALTADSGFERPVAVLDEDSVSDHGVIDLDGNRALLLVTDRQLRVTPATRVLVDLLRKELTATDPIAAYVDVTCEMERLYQTQPNDADMLIHEANQIAIDPVRDRKALRRIDDALAGHGFGNCAFNRKRYGKLDR